MQRTRRSVLAAVAVAGCLLAACSTQVDGRATAAAGAGPTSAPASTSARETARPPSSTSRPPSTTTTPTPSVAGGADAVCRALDGEVPPTIDDVNAFVDALDTEDPDDDTAAADTAVQVVGATVGVLTAALGASGLDPANGLAAAVTALDDALTRISGAITSGDTDGFNTAIDDFNASYDTATSLCSFI